MKIKQFLYYKKAKADTSGSLTKLLYWMYKFYPFNLTFPQIRNSFIHGSLLDKLKAYIRWKMLARNQSQPKDAKELSALLPMTKPEFGVNYNQIKYTWIGHSTAVISFGNDANFIIDPVFSERASPFQFIGPKRYRNPACSLSGLPKIDFCLVSHDHYDHLDQNAINTLFQLNSDTNFVAGLQSEDVFPKKCQLKTMDWTQTYQRQINGNKFKITFVPVCHWSRRWVFDYNKRLWGGFVIESPTGKKVFYSGDTGYCQIFQELQQNFDYFDLAILPIGTYKPKQFLSYQHINPEQAVTIHQQIRSKKSVGVHWGTFPLGNEHFTAPREDLKKALTKKRLDEKEFITIGHGQSFTIPYL